MKKIVDNDNVELVVHVKYPNKMRHEERPTFTREVLEEVSQKIRGMGAVYSGDAWDTENHRVSVQGVLSQEARDFLVRVRQIMTSPEQEHDEDLDYLAAVEARANIPVLLEIISHLTRS